MPEKATDTAPPAGKRRWYSRLLPRTVPGCAALLTGFFLACVAAIVWTVFYVDPNNVPWRHAIGFGRVALVIFLVILIPLILYRGLRLWLEGERSLYPEIDNAWTAGIEALEEQGLDLRDMALYLIIGSRSTGQERAIMQTGKLDLRVDGVPDGPGPLHWYATPDSVYLFCSDASWSSALAAKRQRHFEEYGEPVAAPRRSPRSVMPSAAAPTSPPAAAPAPTPTPAPGPTTPAPAASPQPGRGPQDGSYLGTVQLDQFLAPSAEATPAGTAASGAAAAPGGASGEAFGGEQRAAAPADFRGTVSLEGGWGSSETYAAVETETVFGDTGSDRKPITINSKEATQRIARLTYLCQHINRVREPLCPINGILSLLPFAAIDGGTEDAEALQQAVKSDLTTIHYVLQVRCPVTALVVDMERQTGFRELMRRVGRERASAQRFGRKFDCRSLATEAEMEILSEHVCGTFEDWVYALFREDEALTRPGNQRLYHLLCKIRCTLKIRLAELLQGAFAFDPEQCSAEDGLLFSGCYFAATGERSDHRAFVGGILSKLDDEQELLEWTSEALFRQQRWERAATAGLIVAIALLGLLIWLVLW